MPKMTTFKLPPKHLDMWLHQNDGVVTDVVEGTLLDSMIVATRRGWATLYESYVNPNESEYFVEFQMGSAPDVWDNWEAFLDKALQDAEALDQTYRELHALTVKDWSGDYVEWPQWAMLALQADPDTHLILDTYTGEVLYERAAREAL